MELRKDLDDVINERHFQKVKEYLEEHGKAPAIIIADATKVPVGVINKFLRQGRIEIPEGEEKYIQCERCKAEIRYGRYCPACAAEIGKKLKVALSFGEIGEVPKARTGKMRFLDKR